MEAAASKPCAMPVRAGHLVERDIERVIFGAEFERLAPVGPKVFLRFVCGWKGSGGVVRIGSGWRIRK